MTTGFRAILVVLSLVAFFYAFLATQNFPLSASIVGLALALPPAIDWFRGRWG
jgi:hypothetical protein